MERLDPISQETVLIRLSRLGYVTTVCLGLDYGAKIEATNIHKYTASTQASAKDSAKVFDQFLLYGAISRSS